MKKAILLLSFIFVYTFRVLCQDAYADSLKQAISHLSNDTSRISAKLELARYSYYYLLENDTPIIIAEEARKLAHQKGIVNKEAEALYWKEFFSFGLLKPGEKKMISEALLYARQHQVKDAESNLLILMGRETKHNKDSAKLLSEQALAIATQYQLPEQKANALALKGTLFTATYPDTARKLFSTALDIIRQSGPKQAELNLLRTISNAWLLNKADTAMYYMQLALHFTQGNSMISEELNVLSIFIPSESGYFLRDSLEKYYLRIRSLCRQYKRDSVIAMRRYVQSSQDVGNYIAALQTGLQMLRIAEEKKDTALIQLTLYSIGLSYEYSFDYAKAILFLNRAKPLRKWDGFTYIFTLDDLSRCYLELHLNDSARYYAAACYNAATNYFGSEAAVYGGVLNDLGIIYFEMGEDSLAYNYLQRSYYYFITNNIQPKNYTITTVALAKYFDKHGPADSVLYYARLSFDMAQDNGFLENITAASELIARYYQKTNIDSAYYYQAIGFDAYKKLYSYESSREFQNLVNTEQQREEEVALAKKLAEDKYASNLKLYGLLTTLAVAIIIGLISYRNSRQRRKSYDLLKKQKQEIDLQKTKLEESIIDLKSTQAQLIQSEKMASLGELTAGIAHEIQNPLNFVNNFSDVNKELLGELKEEADKGNIDEVKAIADDIIGNEEKINHHGKRADAIVKGMLQHSRTSTGVKEPTDINALADEYLRLAYHGMRGKDNSFNVTMKTDFDENIGSINIIPQDIGRVLLNLYNNAFYAVNEKVKSNPDSYRDEKYEPTVTVSTRSISYPLGGRSVEIKVSDNGGGIPQKIIAKIFQPFFTTKPTGQGTGLGLSLSYDIIKAHGGEIKVETKEKEGTAFIIQLPLKNTGV